MSAESREGKLMEIVLREVDRLNALIEDFLSYARPRTMRRVSLDLRELIDETVALIRQDVTLAKDLAFEVIQKVDPVDVEGDGDALKQVLWNLLKNSAEAMNGAGTISIELDSLYAGMIPAPQIEISISDTGTGLDAEQRARLFEPFFTTKAGGTGLGLATVHRLVEAHNGTILADENNARGGATFRLMLPVEDPEKLLHRRDPSQSHVAVGSRRETPVEGTDASPAAASPETQQPQSLWDISREPK